MSAVEIDPDQIEPMRVQPDVDESAEMYGPVKPCPNCGVGVWLERPSWDDFWRCANCGYPRSWSEYRL